ncbi:uncharacterized protein HaLaN_02385 [Haematococcus lacustris]|uniref:Uncharacterized protein n=1 Tax=Haematococcus lacustris TaxID=44745 RepID=A0A699YKX3_HAELA|nr:uncharacterized protein HaLaN_02385 [Haematococcus lacustris]
MNMSKQSMQNVPHTTSSPHPCIMARKTDKKGKGSVGKGSSGNLDDAPPAPAPATAAASVPDVAPVAETESPVEPEARQESSRSVLPEPVESAEAQSQLREALEEIAALKKQLAERDEEIAVLKKTSSGSTPAPADFSHEMTKLQERLALLRKEQMEADAAKEAAWLQLKGVIADITKLAATPPSSSLPVEGGHAMCVGTLHTDKIPPLVRVKEYTYRIKNIQCRPASCHRPAPGAVGRMCQFCMQEHQSWEALTFRRRRPAQPSRTPSCSFPA